MNSLVFSLSSFLSVSVIVLLLFIRIPLSLSNNDLFSDCSNQFVCGNITADFPFWGSARPSSCGIPELELKCENNITKMNINEVRYRVLDIKQDTEILRIAREDSLVGLCPPQFVNSTFDPMMFESVTGYMNFTFVYGCLPFDLDGPALFTCRINGVNYQSGFVLPKASGPGACYSSVFFPAPVIALPSILDVPALKQYLKKGFEIRWKVDSTACRECLRSAGACGYDSTSNETTCYWPNQSRGSNTYAPTSSTPTAAPVSEETSNPDSLKIGLSIAGTVVGVFLGCWIMTIIQLKRRKVALLKSKDLPIAATPSSKGLATSTNLSQTTPSLTPSKSDIDKGSTYFGVRVFSYNELEEATNCFDSSKELGDGGFGTVYYGVLRDGRVVAVKRLYESNMRRAEQFMNEIEILAHLRHMNLVELYGCTSRHSRELLLVYEYIPNGTVADHLHGRQSNSGLLTWPFRLSIAIETASALAYLHASDVIHHALNELVDPFLGFDKDFVVRKMVTSVAELAFRCLQQQREMRPTMEEVLEILRRIEKENYGAEKADELDIREDDVGLLKHPPPPLQLSPDSMSDQF